MSLSNNWTDWLTEAEEPAAIQAPQTDPSANIVGAAQGQGGNNAPPQDSPEPEQPDNVEDDPVDPDKDENDSQPQDFEQWKHDFCELSIKGDPNEMLSSLKQIDQIEGLEASQKRFIDDNMQVVMFRQDANIINATKQIRNLIKQELDTTNPGSTVTQHITAIIEKQPLLINHLIKCSGLYGIKGEIHRKWVCAILGAVQVGGGANKQDLMYFSKDYTINLSTRFATQFGEINLGFWSLLSDDPARYLTEPEMDRLSDGSPEEKQTLRRRIILESIGEKFKERGFVIHIVKTDGTLFSLGWDLGDSLLSGYKDGKIIVRGKQNSEKDAMISDNGDIITLIDIDILFVRETGETDDDGKPSMTEVPLIQRRNSKLYLAADLETLQAAAASLSGMFFHEMPYNGNPSDVLAITNCIPSLSMILNQRCGAQ